MLYCGLYLSSDRPRRPSRKGPAIYTDTRTQQGDLIVGLLHLLDRNRLALVVLGASLAAGARSKAREKYADFAAARWLARNARLVRHFLASLSVLRRCAGQAGYRALDRAQSPRRLQTAPRRLLAPLASFAPAVASAPCGPDRLRLMVALARL